MSVRGIILLILFIGSLPVCFFRPFYGVLLWTIVAFLNPQAFTWTADIFPWAMAVAIPTVAGLAAFGGRWSALASREVAILVLIWIWFTVTSIVSVQTPMFMHHAEDTWYRWSFISKILLMTVVTIPIVSTFARLRWFLITIAGSFGFFVLKGFPFLVLTAGTQRIYGPPLSMIADNNDFGLAMNMTLPFFFFLAQSETKPWVRRMFWMLFLMTIPVIFFTYSRGALVGMVAVSTLMILQLRQRWLLLPVMGIAAVLAVVLAPQSWQDRMDLTRSDAVDASAKSRFNAWTFCWRLASDFPVFGGGFDTFTPELFLRYAPNAADVHGPHSVYFGVLAEHGFVGLALYLLLILSCFAKSRKIVRQAKRHGDYVVANYANITWFSMVGFLTSGMFLGRAYFDYYFALVACVAILDDVCHSGWASGEENSAGAQEEQHATT